VINTIAGAFAGGGDANSARKKHLCIVHQVNYVAFRPRMPPITFTDDDFKGVDPSQDDPMVISISRIFIKLLIITNKCYKTINISNIFPTFKYVKHYYLGQMLRSTFLTNLRIKIMNKCSNFNNKITISIINQ